MGETRAVSPARPSPDPKLDLRCDGSVRFPGRRWAGPQTTRPDRSAGPQREPRLRLRAQHRSCRFRDDEPNGRGSKTPRLLFATRNASAEASRSPSASPRVPTRGWPAIAHGRSRAEVGELFLLRVVYRGRGKYGLRCGSCSLTGRACEPNLRSPCPSLRLTRAYNVSRRFRETLAARVVGQNSVSIVRRAPTTPAQR